ncbi:MAG TPA: hypothetical protein VJC10_01080 [Patescibacteria group bacterium]|nr:hypothetical protein [Patescibacteria group bacterium]
MSRGWQSFHLSMLPYWLVGSIITFFLMSLLMNDPVMGGFSGIVVITALSVAGLYEPVIIAKNTKLPIRLVLLAVYQYKLFDDEGLLRAHIKDITAPAILRTIGYPQHPSRGNLILGRIYLVDGAEAKFAGCDDQRQEPSFVFRFEDGSELKIPSSKFASSVFNY